ncbi:amidohydrolase family protein [Pontimicrobium sp. SW4]|uniref:Amidohydrolase family protein n=1 Tax=Pontimicrobium sp. SW4 TaxID=3153519 RepID=A0AAU7BQM7_9FLAO
MKNILWLIVVILFSCSSNSKLDIADTVITNARVYTLSWDDPSLDGVPAQNASIKNDVWQPDAQAIAIKNGLIQFVGSNEEIQKYIGENTKIVDAKNAFVVPGLIESHGHVHEIGEKSEMVALNNLSGDEIIEAIYQKSLQIPVGEWIIGYGWDEAEFANEYPDMIALSNKVKNHPVALQGLRGFGAMGNALAFELAEITTETVATDGGEILKDEKGNLKYVLLNHAKNLLDNKIPKKTLEQRGRILKYGLNHLASLGYTTAHHAGVVKEWMEGYEDLDSRNELLLRTQIFVAARMHNIELVEEWVEKGPTSSDSAFLQVKTFKAYYDGSLGSRGANFLEDYSDQPGHKGVASTDYGFHEGLIKKALDAGFQLAIHCIGDKANREVLDLYDDYFKEHPESRDLRHRIEHAQIIHPDDFTRFKDLNIVASLEPGHAVEDMPWAIDRVGEERIKGGYAWRSLRKAGATVIFNSDYAGTDPSFFYGAYCAITKQKRDDDKQWFPEQVFTPEETLRAYTIWAAYASKQEHLTGTIEKGKWADFTFMDMDVLNIGNTNPNQLLNGQILKTMVNGKVVYEK